MRRTTYHDEVNRRCIAMYHLYEEEEVLTRRIKQLERQPRSERNRQLIASARKQLADLIACNISRY